MLIIWLQARSISGMSVTDGKVTAVSPSIRVEYFDNSQTSRVCVSSFTTTPPCYSIGQNVRIAFSEDNPGSSRLLTFGARFGVAWVILGVGLMLLWIVLGFFYGSAYLNSIYPNKP